MIEFIQLCFAPINLVFTVLMGLVIAYWTLFVIGFAGMDLDDVDFDLDADVDMNVDLDVEVGDVDIAADVDADVDADLDASADGGEVSGGGRGLLIALLKFVNLGDVPLMVLISAFIASIWGVSILSTYYFNRELSVVVALISFIPDLLISLVLTKILTIPSAALFRKANSGIENRTKIVGRTCYVTTSRVTEKSGQAEIRLDDAAPITLNVRCPGGASRGPLKKGDEALILELVEDKGTYIVVPFNLEVN